MALYIIQTLVSVLNVSTVGNNSDIYTSVRSDDGFIGDLY